MRDGVHLHDGSALPILEDEVGFRPPVPGGRLGLFFVSSHRQASIVVRSTPCSLWTTPSPCPSGTAPRA
jgi:hypothetical protein